MNKHKTILITALLGVFGFFSIAFAQTATVSAPQPWRFQCDPKFDSTGKVTSAVVTVFFRSAITDASGAVLSYVDAGSSSWDAATEADIVDSNGGTLKRSAVLKGIIADAFAVKAKAKAEAAKEAADATPPPAK